MNTYNYDLHITSRKILISFSSIIFIFLLIYYLPYFIDIKYNYFIVDYMNITQEKNVPTFFSFTIMLLISFVYFLLYKERKKYYWLIISIFFLYLGFDDMFTIHENLGSEVGHTVVEDTLNTKFTTYYWQAVFMPIFAIFGLFIVYQTSKAFYNKGCNKCIIIMFIGYGLYVIAIAMDYYEGMDTDFFWLLKIFKSLDYDSLIDVMRATEEGIEMLGGTLILTALLKLKEIHIRLS